MATTFQDPDSDPPPKDGQKWLHPLSYIEYRWSAAQNLWITDDPAAIPRPGVDPKPKTEANLPEGQRDLILE